MPVALRSLIPNLNQRRNRRSSHIQTELLPPRRHPRPVPPAGEVLFAIDLYESSAGGFSLGRDPDRSSVLPYPHLLPFSSLPCSCLFSPHARLSSRFSWWRARHLSPRSLCRGQHLL